jgi:MFS family permease
MTGSPESTLTGKTAFKYPDFLLFQSARLFIILAQAMQSVAVGWQVYDITKRPLDLGLVGLAQFLPSFLLFLVSGHTSDRFDRRRILLCCYLGFGVCWALLLEITLRHPHSVIAIYGVLVLLGVVRSFSGPADRSLLPQIIPEQDFQNAVAWASIIGQFGRIVGPALGGVLYSIFRGPAVVYGAGVVSAIFGAASMMRIKSQSKSRRRDVSLQTVVAGMRYIWQRKLIFGSISLDLFAVLLGGAVALLPVYAREILRTGPWGLGLLRSAPGVGAGSMALLMAYRPLRRRAGPIMLTCVAGFGLFTVIFGLSRSLMLSLLALVLVGATDMVSVIVRATTIQLATPDEMRGRVSAVDMIFIGASNELGEFESGLTAAWFGTVPAVVLGGIGTLIVTALWTWLFPELRRADRLTVEHLQNLTVSQSEGEAVNNTVST